MVEIFGCDLDFQKSATSQIITNSKSKECGPLSLHDVNPVVSCVQSRTKIMMLSFFKLVSKRKNIFQNSLNLSLTIIFQVSEVKAAFILWSKEENCTINDHSILSRLKQPEDCTVFNQTVITCIAPPQSWDVIQEIRQKNLELRIFAYRPSDNRLSRNSFKFEYLEHVQAAQQTKHSFYGPTGKNPKLTLPNSPNFDISKLNNQFFINLILIFQDLNVDSVICSNTIGILLNSHLPNLVCKGENMTTRVEMKSPMTSSMNYKTNLLPEQLQKQRHLPSLPELKSYKLEVQNENLLDLEVQAA